MRVNEYQTRMLEILEQQTEHIVTINNKLEKLILQRGNDRQTVDETEPIIATKPDIIQVSGLEAPWVQKILTFEGMHEVHDQKELQDFLGFNPNDRQADGKPWCAGFLKRVLEECGIDTTGLDLSVNSFMDFGYECEEVDGAIMIFQPDDEADFPIRHIGVCVDVGVKLLGGNQGNSCKRSNLAWYKQNAELVRICCPDRYKLVA